MVTTDTDLRDLATRLVAMAPEVPPYPDSAIEPRPSQRRRRPIVVLVGAALAVLITIGGVTWLLAASRGALPDDPADTVTTTIASTTTSATTTTDAIIDADDPVGGAPATINWTMAEVPEVGDIYGVTAGDGMFFAVGHAIPGSEATEYGWRPEAVSEAQASIWYSQDAVEWTRVPRSVLPSLDGLNGISYGNGMVLVRGDYEATGPRIWRSTDVATSWETVDPEQFDERGYQSIADMAPGGPGWIAVGHSERDGRIWVSSDGLEWQTIALEEFAEVQFHDVSVIDGVITVTGRPAYSADVSIPSDLDVVALRWTSTDGLTWDPIPLQATAVGPETHTISVNPATGEAVATNIYGVWTSPDGVTWTRVFEGTGFPPYDHPVDGVVWIGDAMVGFTWRAVGFFESTDGGATWVRTDPDGTGRAQAKQLMVSDGAVIGVAGTVWVGSPDA